VRADCVEIAGIEWLWSKRFAVGKLSLVVGLPDEGKELLTSYIVAQVTCAGLWPCNEGHAPLGNVLMFTDEDDHNDTVVPRLAAAGADRKRVEIVKMVSGTKDRMFNLVTDLELLRRKIVEMGDVRAVLIDPITAYLGLGKIDSFRTGDVRAVLTPLCNLAAELRVAIIAIMHFNKKVDVTNALLRISDSLAFAAVARGVYGVIDDAEHERKLFVRAKNNLAARDQNKTLAFRFTACEVGIDKNTGEVIRAPYIVWDPQYVDVTASEAMQAAAESKSPAARDEAQKFLTDILANGPILKTEIEEAAEANGIAERTLRRAKTELKIIAKKDGDGAKWRWHLPKPQAHFMDERCP
jgi:AAA domain